MVLYRSFFPLFALLECTGEPVVGQVPRCERKVQYLEKLFGTLLVAGQVVMAQLRDRLRLVKERYQRECLRRRLQQTSRICDWSHMRLVLIMMNQMFLWS